MPLESKFSEQVTQPYLLESFPVQPFEPHDDRLFRHITFQENGQDLTLRLRAINLNHLTESSVIQKHVQTNLSAQHPHSEKFRVKAVLNQPEHGIDHSYWVENQNLDSQEVISHNQYRMRGVSTQNWKSDWVYSELRDYDNELIVYNMLHDVLDLLMTIHDDQIDYLMDYIVSDTFVSILKEKLPQLTTSLGPEEFQVATIEEFLHLMASKDSQNPNEQMATHLGEHFSLLADELKKEFKENVMATPKEFSELYRSYRLFDQYNHQQKDAINLLMELFLEDRVEKCVQKTDIEVLLQNDEEMGIYLNGRYEFNIKADLINAVYSASPSDAFVTKLHDAVSLLSEPVVFESFVVDKDENVGKFLRLILAEIFTPLVAVDQRFVELEHALEDRAEIQPTGSLIEFATMNGEDETRTMFLYDVMESLLMGDVELTQEYEATILEQALRVMNDTRKSLFIDYQFEEFLQVFTNIGEVFQREYKKLFTQPKEQKEIYLVDQVHASSTNRSRSLKESYSASLHDTFRLSLAKEPEVLSESTHVSVLDTLIHRHKMFNAFIEDRLQASLQDALRKQMKKDSEVYIESVFADSVERVFLRDTTNSYQSHEEASAGLIEEWMHLDKVHSFHHLEEITMRPENIYYNLFKHFLREPNRYPILERNEQQLSHDLMDLYILDGGDQVQYALGDMGDSWPLGVFRLGTNTLRGEV